MIAAVVTLMSCERAELSAIGATSAPQIQVSTVEDVADTIPQSIVERRHFAIYSMYQVLFDDSASDFQAGISGHLEGAVTTAASDIPPCSLQTILLPD